MDAGERLRRLNWYGLKGVLKNVAGFAPLNRPLLAAIDHLPALRRRIRRFPVARAEVACQSDGGAAFFMLSPLSCAVAKELYWGGGQRRCPEDRVAARLFAAQAAQSDWVLDVGAYSGFFSLLSCAVNPAVRVLAFEIVPENFLLLMRNLCRNDCLAQVEARLQGLGAPGDSMRLPLAFDSSELPSSISRRDSASSGVRIPFTSLDSLAGRVQGRGLMKVDVEGTEDSLFAHGAEFLARHRPEVLCEVLERSATAATLTSLLRPLGYRLYRVGAAGLERHDTIRPHRRFKDWYFSCKDEAELRRCLAAPGSPAYTVSESL